MSVCKFYRRHGMPIASGGIATVDDTLANTGKYDAHERIIVLRRVRFLVQAQGIFRQFCRGRR